MAVTPTRLPTRPLGQSGLDLSVLGLGTVKFGRNTDVKYPQAFALPTDDEIFALLEVAGSLGINYLDTAPAYGRSEARLGSLLAQCPHRFQIITKAGEHYDPAHGSQFDFSPAGIRRSVERSLTQLQRATLDVVLLHSDGDDLRILDQGALETLLRCQAEGLIKAVGLSGKTYEGGQRALAEGANVLMVTLNVEQRAEAPLIREAVSRGAGILVKKALASGHLDQNEDPAIRLAALLHDPGITSAVVGTLNPDHLRHNCQHLLSGETV